MERLELKNSEYLGDAVYVEKMCSRLKLFTYNGIDITNTIYLDEQVINNFIEYIRKLKEKE